jgi:Protein of unknown function (DUF3300)
MRAFSVALVAATLTIPSVSYSQEQGLVDSRVGPSLESSSTAQPDPFARANSYGSPLRAPRLTVDRLDQMLAPIALFPDQLLGEILMAATYPLDAVEAARWLQDPSNASLKGDQLIAALRQQNWDQSVKSLAPFPSILRMMDAKLDWTERLGEAFLADPKAVMDAVQRLRRRAQSAGGLVSSPQEIVRTVEEGITIEAPTPEIVYVPVCDPSVAYGAWPYPAYPPDSFSAFFNGAGEFGCGWASWPIIPPLWGLFVVDFRDHHIHISHDRFALIDENRPPTAGGEWRHDPFHRGNVPYREPEVAARYGGAAPRREILRAFHEPQTGSSPRIDEPIARLPERERVRRFEGVDPDRNEFVARRSLPGLQGVNPDGRTFVQRGTESRDRGEGVPSRAEHGYSIRMLAPEWARRSARLPPFVGGRWEAPLSGSNMRHATSPSRGIPGGGFRAQ